MKIYQQDIYNLNDIKSFIENALIYGADRIQVKVNYILKCYTVKTEFKIELSKEDRDELFDY